MFDYLKQFKSLPKELREKISSPVAMKTLSDLEEKYNITLASTVMKVMVKDIAINNLSSYLVSEFSLSPNLANKLSNDLKEKLFFSVSGYLGIKPSFSQEEDQAREIIKQSGIRLADKNIYNRSIKLISTFLKGVRSKIDTRLVLEKPIEHGGLGLDQEKAEHILRTYYQYIANLDNNLKKEEKISVEPSLLTESDVLTKLINQEKLEKESEFNLKKEIEAGRTPSISAPEKVKEIEGQKEEIKKLAPVKKEIKEKKEEEKKEEEKEEEEKIENIVSFAPPPKKSLISGIFTSTSKGEEKKNQPEKKEEIKQEKKEPEKKWSSVPRPVSDSGSKQKIEDIKTAPKVMGPVDELRYLDIVNFRRLSEDPNEAVLKIKKKIELLEKDGYDRKIQAVLAWKKSPVNRLYILIGQEAVSQGLSIQNLVEKKLEKNKNSLTWQEIKAIMKLNSQLSFY
jgi:hypothetical protein